MSPDHMLTEGYERLGDINEVVVRCLCDPYTILGHYPTWPNDTVKAGLLRDHLEALRVRDAADAADRDTDGASSAVAAEPDQVAP